MRNKKEAFSLAELMISLLVVSLLLSAVMPAISKKGNASLQIWKWITGSESPNSIYFGPGENQSVLIGSERIPENNITDGEIQQGDRLIIVKTAPKVDKKFISPLKNSHITFYNLAQDGPDVTTLNREYAGRLSLDKTNIALGRASLPNLNVTSSETKNIATGNLAIGHNTLSKNTKGFENIAIGNNALENNEFGDANTAIGYGALQNNNGKDTDHTQDPNNANRYNPNAYGSQNTAIGFYALNSNTTGFGNVSIGFRNLYRNKTGQQNVAIGYDNLLRNTQGIRNIAIGYKTLTDSLDKMKDQDENHRPDYNIALGADTGKQLYIGQRNIFMGTETAPVYRNSYYNILMGNKVANHITDGNYNIALGHRSCNYLPPDFKGKTDEQIIEMTEKTDYLNAANDNICIGTLSGYYSSTSNARNLMNYKLYIGSNYSSTGAYNKDTNPDVIPHSLIEGVHLHYKKVINSTTIEEKRKLEFNVEDGIYIRNWYNPSATPNQPQFKQIAIEPESIENEDSIFNVKYNSNEIKFSKLNSAGEVDPNKYVSINDGDVSINDGDVSVKNGQFSLIDDSRNGIYLSNENGEFQINNYIPSGGFGFYQKDINRSFQLKNGNFTIDSNNITVDYEGNISANGIIDANGLGSTLTNIIKGWITTSSDIRLKNIDGDFTAGLNEINKIEVKKYTYKSDKEKTPHVGVIAQQLMKIFPDAVTKDKDGYYRIRTEDMFYAMINSIKELSKNLQELVAKISGLDKKVTELEKQNKQLIKQNQMLEKRLDLLEKKLDKKADK